MAFNGKQHAGMMKSRYNQHQSIAAGRIAMKGGVTKNKSMDTRNTHGALPKQGAPGTNKTQTIQKDINKSHGVPAQSSHTMLNKNALQQDLMGVTGKVRKPGMSA